MTVTAARDDAEDGTMQGAAPTARHEATTLGQFGDPSHKHGPTCFWDHRVARWVCR